MPSGGTPVTESRETLERVSSGHQIIVLGNREPYSHERTNDGRIVVRHSASGLVNAVEPLLAACGGVWVAHGSASADQSVVDETSGVYVPPEKPAYRLRRVWFSEEEYSGYYYGFANEALWPLCHRVFVKPVFRASDLDAYWIANARFADAVAEEAAGDSPIVLVQDYHFALAPAMIRQQLPASTISTFWHVPWPDWQTFSVCPWRAQLLDGLLGSCILGFQTLTDRSNFAETVSRVLQLPVNRDSMSVDYGGRQVRLRVYPASIPWTPDPKGPSVAECRASVRKLLRLDDGIRLAVGVDRLDYTKGIEEKFLAVEQLLLGYPEFREKLSLVQLAEPTRPGLEAYTELRRRVRDTADRINREFGTKRYHPITLIEGRHSQEDVTRFLRAADICYVGSLADGMNLVGKEFVRARIDERAVLVLSVLAGAARQLNDAVLVNPFDPTGAAGSLAVALQMDPDEQQARMRRMRRCVAASDAHRWAAAVLQDAIDSRPAQTMMPLRTAYSTTSAVL
jgi:trehalose 6-phosphate synthase